MDAITKANYICNELGLDTITMATTIACAMDLYESGYITTKDTGGMAIPFGSTENMVKLVEMTANREGFGDQLAEGSFRLGKRYGHSEYSMTTKMQEMPAYDPRGVQGIGLNFATSNCGAAHVRGYTISPEVLGVPFKVDQHTTEGKPQLVITFQNLTAALDSTGSCLFTTFGIGAEELAALLSSVTGIQYTVDDFMKAGDRIWNLERLFDLKSAITGKDDRLPERMMKEPIQTGPSKGEVSQLDKMIPEYYQLRGWDTKGVPTPEKLKDLSLA
jgi:aldehyde:ferredoxin oxidoreductase